MFNYQNAVVDKSPDLVFIVCSLQAAIKNLKSRSSWSPYTREEIAIIKQYYLDCGAAYCQQFMPHRSVDTISKKAKSLGLVRRIHRPWAQAEIDILIDCISQNMTLKAIWCTLGEVGYSRTFAAVRDKTKELRKFVINE